MIIECDTISLIRKGNKVNESFKLTPIQLWIFYLAHLFISSNGNNYNDCKIYTYQYIYTYTYI